MPTIGIIGGSGLDDPKLLKDPQTLEIRTRFGAPSSPISCGTIKGVKVALLARHGTRHQFSPTEVNNRANILALQQAGASHILATTACGSLREEIGRGDFVVLDQFIDFTRFRKNTFFESFANEQRHTPMAEPFDDKLRKDLIQSGKNLGITVHDGGCVITIEGPRFSTRAESKMFRSWGADLINMSTAPEAILAMEARIPYAAIAMSTDYDSWKEDEIPVSWEEILSVFQDNAERMKALLQDVIIHFHKTNEEKKAGA